MTLERAAAEAAVSVREMMEYLRTKKLPGQYELKDLEQDMMRFYKKVTLPRADKRGRARMSKTLTIRMDEENYAGKGPARRRLGRKCHSPA
jgi:hypothetical protein